MNDFWQDMYRFFGSSIKMSIFVSRGISRKFLGDSGVCQSEITRFVRPVRSLTNGTLGHGNSLDGIVESSDR